MAGSIIQAGAQGLQNRGNAMATYKQEMHNAAIARQNAALSREEAARSRREADLAEEAHRRVVIEDLGRAFTAAAQSGARGGGGTTTDRLLAQEATLAELDALNIRYGGDRERTAHLTDAANFDFEASMAKKRAKAQLHTIRAGTAGSILTAASTYGAGSSGSGFNFGANRNYGEMFKTVRSKKTYGSGVKTRSLSNTNRSIGGRG